MLRLKKWLNGMDERHEFKMKKMRLNKEKFARVFGLFTIIVIFTIFANTTIIIEEDPIVRQGIGEGKTIDNVKPSEDGNSQQKKASGEKTGNNTEMPGESMPAKLDKKNADSNKSINKDADKNNDKSTDKPNDKSADKLVKNTGKKSNQGIIRTSENRDLRQVAITFDDGPDKKYTRQILDILKDNNIKATFFCVGVNIIKNPNVLKNIAEEGHVIGNHSWSHKVLTKLSKEDILKEIVRTEKQIEELTGGYTPIFRPPYGSCNNEMIELAGARGYKCVNWSVDTKDWSGIPTDSIMKKVRKELGPGGIILLHCSGEGSAMEGTIKVLPEIIGYVRSMGYEFVTVPEMLNIK